MERPRLALLPLYLELYDRTLPALLSKQTGFLAQVTTWLTAQGAEVAVLPVCRTREQVAPALATAEAEGALGLVTLHLAYSPSLETAPALAESDLPILLLDTTPAQSFGADATTDDVLVNHGIHGVQDLASVLRRMGRTYAIAAGPLDAPALAAKVRAWMRALSARRYLRALRVALVGDEFKGMGDFNVSADFLKEKVGPTLLTLSVADIGARCADVNADAVARERRKDALAFECECGQPCWDNSNRVGLALRHELEVAQAKAFSMNFASFDRAVGTAVVPFLEASKAMARDLGYAGEGDVLTASLVAVLNACYGSTTFTEMFCPDWRGDRVFMSHMGECNPALSGDVPRLVEKDYGFGPADNPAILVFPLQPGPAALVNLAPRRETVALIAADVRIADMTLSPRLASSPHFWVAPSGGSVAGFLETYSEAGGTHHLALTPGLRAGDLAALARMMGWEFVAVQ